MKYGVKGLTLQVYDVFAEDPKVNAKAPNI